MALALAWKECGLGQKEIGREFGVGLHAVRKAIARANEFRRLGGPIGRDLKRLTSIFKARNVT